MGTRTNFNKLFDRIRRRQESNDAGSDHWHLANEVDARVNHSMRHLLRMFPFGITIIFCHYLLFFWLEPWFVLFVTFTMLWLGARDIFRLGFGRLAKGRPGQESLWSLAIITPVVFSIIAQIFHIHWPDLYYLAALALLAIRLIEYLKSLFERLIKKPILAMAELSGGKANVRHNRVLEEVNIDEIQVGDMLAVKPGEKIPVDGVIIKGGATVNEASLTGQIELVNKSPGDFVLGGTFNKHGEFEYQVTKVGAEMALSKMLKLAQKAEAGYIELQDKIKSSSVYFCFSVIILSLVIVITQISIAHRPSGEVLSRIIGLYMVVSPMSLVSIIPLAVMTMISRGLKDGIIIRRAANLTKIFNIKVVSFDKTNTITEGKFQVKDVIPITRNMTADWVLGSAAAIESLSDHPLSEAILKHWNRPVKDANSFEVVSGQGLRGIVEGKRMILGNQGLMQQYNIEFGAATIERIRQLEKSGKTLLFLARENTQLSGIIVMEDLVRLNAREAIDAMKRSGWRTVLLSGDNSSVTELVGHEIGADEIVGAASSVAKAEAIKQHQDENKLVAMIGSGESDMAAVSQADLGIVLSPGDNLETHHGQITILGGTITQAKKALDLGRAAAINALENFGLAFVYNVAVIVLVIWGKIPVILAPAAAILPLALIMLNVWRLSIVRIK